MKTTHYHLTLLGVGIVALIGSGFMARDFFTWVLEVSPAIIGWIVLIATYRRFTFSNLVYTLILLHSFVLMYGGIYTYAETPFGYWMSDVFGWSRNNYDKIGHFMQGFVPALIARELFVRLKVIALKRWLAWLVIAVTLALSAFYEFIEWWISLLSGSAGDAFLGTQGYIWDTQSDMLLCLIGTLAALIVLTRAHNASMQTHNRSAHS
ncbi:MAG: DUF2238 domain-containing protein [bacterium]|nr:DUF2238 domain-containing protein [bacterium]